MWSNNDFGSGTTSHHQGGSGRWVRVGHFSTSTVAGTTTNVMSVTNKVLSSHSGGFHAAFADGHVQFLMNQLDIPTFIHIMTPWDKGVPDNTGTTNTYAPYYNLQSYYPVPQLSPLEEANLQ